MTCLSSCKVALIAFVRSFSRVSLLATVGVFCLFLFHIIADRFQRKCVHPGDQYITVQTGKLWFSRFQLLLSMSNLVVTLLTTDIFIFWWECDSERDGQIPTQYQYHNDYLEWDEICLWIMMMLMVLRMMVMNRFAVNPHEQSPLRFSYTGKLI